jgi:hypothetical protein
MFGLESAALAGPGTRSHQRPCQQRLHCISKNKSQVRYNQFALQHRIDNSAHINPSIRQTPTRLLEMHTSSISCTENLSCGQKSSNLNKDRLLHTVTRATARCGGELGIEQERMCDGTSFCMPSLVAVDAMALPETTDCCSLNTLNTHQERGFSPPPHRHNHSSFHTAITPTQSS